MIQLRIANLMGLDLNSAQHSVAIDEALIGAEDTEAFYQFLEDKKNSIEYETTHAQSGTSPDIHKEPNRTWERKAFFIFGGGRSFVFHG